MKKYRHALMLMMIILIHISQAEGLTRAAFMAGLLNARAIDWTDSPEYQEHNAAAFLLRTGYITDNAGGLESGITRREALRWCIESLGLAFEAEMLSDYPSGYSDAGILSGFERGCLVVASNMIPQLFPKEESFRPHEGLTQQEAESVLYAVRQASVNSLKLDMIRNPLVGLRIYFHREGVPSGIPEWRVYAYGIDKTTANNIRNMLKTQGIEASITGSGVRTEKLNDYDIVRRFAAFLDFRGIKYIITPVLTNTNTRIVPRYWILLTIDAERWKISPMFSGTPQNLAPLSYISSVNGSDAAINGGFFALARGRGYPIGILKALGQDFSTEPKTRRGTMAWDSSTGDFAFTLASSDDYSWYDMENVIQAGPLMLFNGVPVMTDEGFGTALISTRHPRSAVGVNEAGQWVFLIVDGRNGMHSSGATISELTEILQNLRVKYALNLDGGGSTEIIINGKIYNMPSDGFERSISYGLGVFSR